jgi:hypothetical protein
MTTNATATHLVQIDEETAGDAVWDALHAYAAEHPAPACLQPYVDEASCWPAASAITAVDAQLAEHWLAQCAAACGWDDDTTPILVIPYEAGATEAQIEQLRARAVNDVTREIMASGIRLTHEQADELGAEVLGWMKGRLGLNVKATDRGVECTPPKHYSGEESRRAGVETHEER